ncbi:MAG TPA: thiamine phosphate synthase [Capillimicrobium sp.]|nr:thiamine phosphate synthase [Capillimicrobium sp.]
MDRRERLRTARLYFISDARPGGHELADVLGPALEGGVDLFQLRDKDATDDEILAAAAVARDLCAAHGALFVINDRPDLAAAAGADGVHVGQDDASVADARAAVGPDALVGLSTHSPDQIDAVPGDADLIGVGPVYATPTKAGREPAGLELVAHAAAAARVPWFAIGGIDRETTPEVVARGATRIAVVRAIADAPDPRAAAADLRRALP